ncbi:HNH endonuclease [Marinobacter adhaerens]|uniref:HNH endonuclease n=1 Tax=Marinobacter adhaerens TaxID=1033846 RepID=A0A851HYC0_9GAMM|nr:HNH endonuclease signature motif containing protein [Marinobacter adhaerens]NWN92262.1 HNH endonuclease [Marinobacter adhaerens]
MTKQPYRQPWTPQQDAWLRKLYGNTPNWKIAAIMGRKLLSVRNRAVRLGLKKSPEYMEREKPGCFRKGHKTWNKGMAFDSGGRSAESRFRPGHAPANKQPIGTEVLDTYGYLKRKVRDDAPAGKSHHNWKFVHVINWEKANGPLPAGHVVRFRDLDSTNVNPDNLVAVSRSEHAVINRWMAMGELPEGGLDALITMAKLKITMRKRQEELA